MSYPIKQLSQLCDIVMGRTPARNEPGYWGKGNKWVSISDLTSKVICDTKEEITDYAVTQTRCRKVPKGTLLFSFKLTIGKMAFAGCDLYTNEAIAALHIKNKKELYAEYLFFALQVAKLLGSNQAAMGKTLNSKSLAQIEIPIPPLDDQKRIAHLLGKVEGLIARRKQHIQQIDDLLKSVFLEMFGPQAPGYSEWPLVEIKDLAANYKGAMRTGPFGSNLLHSEFTSEGDVAVLGIDNAVQNRFVWGERRFITYEKYQELMNYRIYPRDVIVTIMGTIGRSAVIPDDIPLAINTKHLAAITLNKEIANPLFVSYSIHSSPFILNQFKSKNRGAIMSGLNLGLIKETKLKRPPIALQDQFAAIHRKIDEVKSRYQQSLTDLEQLYGALSQKAFKGELDLSRVVPPPVEVTTRLRPGFDGLAEDTESTETQRNTKSFSRGFARQILAAEILHRHNNCNMTQMKLQKLIHLAEYHSRLDEIQGEYQRQAAGPFDNKMMYGIAAGLKKQQWYEMHGHGQSATYSRLLKAGSHKKYLLKWQNNMVKVDEILQLLGKARPDQCEIVSTLYAAWNDLLIDGAEITDERIIEQASKAKLWHKSKENINPERWPKALQWMRDNNLVPTGYGKHTQKLQ